MPENHADLIRLNGKNRVYLDAASDTVIKCYPSGQSAQYAYGVMTAVYPYAPVAKAYGIRDDTVYMEYIKGASYMDKFLKADEEGALILARMLIDYTLNLSSAGYVQTDNNFTNYIVKDSVYGIDYDEMRLTSDEYDYRDSLSDNILFALTYKGVKESVKLIYAREIIKTGINGTRLNNALKRLIVRRGAGLNEYRA